MVLSPYKMGVENKHICIYFFAELAIKCELCCVIYILLAAYYAFYKTISNICVPPSGRFRHILLFYIFLLLFLGGYIFSSGVQHYMNANSHTHTCAILLKMCFAAVLATFLKHARKVLRRSKGKPLGFFTDFCRH